MLRTTFRSLSGFNYRLWAAGALVSNVGTWMQRTAQDWIVYTELTRHDATAVGFAMALQFGPSLFLLPFTGYIADHFDRRRVLLVTQALQATLALGLGVLTLSGHIELWHVYLFALMLGCVTAFDAPVRQTFVADLVSDANLSNAVALNSTSYQLARMLGPALAGLLIAAIGTGWLFILNFATFGAVIGSLVAMRVAELHRLERAERKPGSVGEGFRYVLGRADLMAVMSMLFLVATFVMNFAVYVSTMAVTVFGTGSGGFGLLSSMLAIGSVTGALASARREKPRAILLVASGFFMAVLFTVAALMPTYLSFGIALMALGWSLQTFMTTANSTVQLSTDPAMRGRVMAIYMSIVNGCTLFGAPFVGWVANRHGARWSLMVGATAGLLAAVVGIRYLVRHRGLHVKREGLRLRFLLADAEVPKA
ncbi:Enterobactin exporter EntS [Usitatibacter rugosus]|uniref:Enterobactin exporter EntS n=1 Tax=Usitatibacter rugosus TaxID=2732067 RepID=A0A6M4GUL8_9PROT|nr:MFS transporter [Usitatibacter rugosus]QJR11020.1 Enterobactin exporter EntS [Usitatibacter rugosus]